MSRHRRNLPHYYPPGATLFLTWRLFGSLPREAKVALETAQPNPGRAFVACDRLLDRNAAGPQWLRQPEIADLVQKALKQGEQEYGLYELLAWVIMSNHVHIVMKPARALPVVTRWIKGSTARAANLLLGRTGNPFWQYESYDHRVRSGELGRIIRYVESNPVAAGLAETIERWPWSSAGAGQKACSTTLASHSLAALSARS
jgi:REP element-mobilizing transposase RayT